MSRIPSELDPSSPAYDYDSLELAARDELPEAAPREETHAPPALPTIQPTSTHHQERAPFVSQVILDVLKDPADGANLVAYAKEILRRNSKDSIVFGVMSNLGEVRISADSMTFTADGSMLAVRCRRDILPVVLIPGVDLSLRVGTNTHRAQFVGAIPMLESIDMLCFVIYDESRQQDFDSTRS